MIRLATVGLDTIAAWNIIAAAVSMVLGILAIGLSITFFVLATRQTKGAESAAQNVAVSVEKLELIFGKLYDDTFTIMRDTVTDMRNHIWRLDDKGKPVQRVEETVGEIEPNREFLRLRSDLIAQVAEVREELGAVDARTAEKLEALESRLKKTPPHAAEHTGTPDFVRRQVLDAVYFGTHRGKAATLTSLLTNLTQRGLPRTEIVSAVFALRRDGLVEWAGPAKEIAEDQEIWATSGEARVEPESQAER